MTDSKLTAPARVTGAASLPFPRRIVHLLAGAAAAGLIGAIWFLVREWLGILDDDMLYLRILEYALFGAIAGIVVSWLTRRDYRLLLNRSSLLERLLAGTSAGVWILNEKRQTIYTNESMRLLLGAVPEEGSVMEEFFSAETWDILEQHLQLRPDGISSAYQVELRQENGTFRTVQVLGSPIIVEPDRYLGSFGIFIDITDQLEDQERVVHRERLQTLFATVSRLNHKISNSLMVIRGQAEVLLRRDREGPDAAGYTRIIVAADAIASEMQMLSGLESVEFEHVVGDRFMVRLTEGDEPTSSV